VAGDVALGDIADLLEDDLALAQADVSIPDRVLRIDQEIEQAVAVPIDLGELGAAAASTGAGVETEGAEVFIDEDALGRLAAATQGEETFLIEGDEVEFFVTIVIDHERGGAPLGEGVAGGRLPPLPLRRILLEARVEGGGLDAERIAGAAEQADAPEDGVVDDVEFAIAIPIGGGKAGVAPLRLAGALDRSVGAGEDAEGFAIGRFDQNGRGPFGSAILRHAEILEEGDVAGGVAAEDVLLSVAVPVDHEGSGERSELQRIGLLLEIGGLMEDGESGVDLAGVLDQGDAAVLVSDDEVEVAIVVPIDRSGRDHLHVHHERLAHPIPKDGARRRRSAFRGCRSFRSR
jgi:hypothetical protein